MHRLPFYRRHKIIYENSSNGIKRGPKKLEKKTKRENDYSLSLLSKTPALSLLMLLSLLYSSRIEVTT
jgi:hypothetical protein